MMGGEFFVVSSIKPESTWTQVRTREGSTHWNSCSFLSVGRTSGSILMYLRSPIP